MLDFGGGWSAWYAHMSKVLVEQGEWVAEKQPIGIMGSTGFSSAPHLHLTLTNTARGLDNYVVAKCLDPAPYLRRW